MQSELEYTSRGLAHKQILLPLAVGASSFQAKLKDASGGEKNLPPP